MRIDIRMEKMSQKALERKSNKPIMEKKRRARINHCLNQLKTLILETDNERSRHSKLEKADILEMTVKYLQALRTYHVHLQQIHQLQQQSQLQQQLQQQRQQLNSAGNLSPVSSAPTSPQSLNLSLAPTMPLQLHSQQQPQSLQQPLSLSQTSPQQHQLSHHLQNLSHHLSQNQLLGQRAHHHHHQHQPAQLSPAWRPW